MSWSGSAGALMRPGAGVRWRMFRICPTSHELTREWTGQLGVELPDLNDVSRNAPEDPPLRHLPYRAFEIPWLERVLAWEELDHTNAPLGLLRIESDSSISSHFRIRSSATEQFATLRGSRPAADRELVRGATYTRVCPSPAVQSARAACGGEERDHGDRSPGFHRRQ